MAAQHWTPGWMAPVLLAEVAAGILLFVLLRSMLGVVAVLLVVLASIVIARVAAAPR